MSVEGNQGWVELPGGIRINLTGWTFEPGEETPHDEAALHRLADDGCPNHLEEDHEPEDASAS